MRKELERNDYAKVPRCGATAGYNPKTFQRGIRPIPGDIIQNNTINGRAQAGAIAFWLTPHGFLKGAAANAASAKASTVKGKRTITFTAFDKFPITATLDNRNLIEHVEALVDIAFTGDTVLDAFKSPFTIALTATTVLTGTYSNILSLDGIQVPMHLVMREGAWPTLEINVAQARPNSQEAIDIVARATSAAPAGPPAAAAA